MTTLAPESVEQIAQRVAELLRAEPDPPAADEWITAAEVARRFSVSRDFVYAHADELGAQPLGDGARPRLRFDPTLVLERLGPRPSPVTDPPRTRPRRRTPATTDLLPIKGDT